MDRAPVNALALVKCRRLNEPELSSVSQNRLVTTAIFIGGKCYF